MIDLFNGEYCPTLDEVREYVRCPGFNAFCAALEGLGAKDQLNYSKCSWMPGWNVKFRKSGRGLCTVYPRENFFTVLVVIGQKEKKAAEAILPECTPEIQAIYRQTEEGNGQRWLMIDLEDEDKRFRDVLKLVQIRKK